MSAHTAELLWELDGGLEIAGSASPQVVPLPWSDAAAVDPEEAFLAPDAEGRLAITRVTLHPQVYFAGFRAPGAADIHMLHEQAHQQCFIANSVRTEILVEPRR